MVLLPEEKSAVNFHLSRLFFWTSVAALVITTTYYNVECIIRYDSRPTYISQEIVEQKFAIVPSITFCSGPENANTVRNMTLQALIPQLRIKLFRSLPGTDESQLNIKPKQYEDYIRLRDDTPGDVCYTIDASDEIKDNGIYFVKLKLLNVFRGYFFIHHPSQFLEALNSSGIRALPDYACEYAVTYEDIRLKPRSVKKADQIGDHKESCSYNSLDTCLRKKYGLDAKNGSQMTSLVANPNVTCPTPCSFLNIHTIKVLELERPRFTSQIFLFSKLIIISKERYLYQFTEMVGEAGGYVGVLLGFSILDLIILLRAYAKNYKRKDRSTLK